ALPVERAERRRRQTVLVHQVRVRRVAPAITDLRWLGDALGVHDDGVVVDDRLGRHKYAVLACDLEFAEGLVAACLQAAAYVSERDANLAAFNLQALVERAGMDEVFFAVVLG